MSQNLTWASGAILLAALVHAAPAHGETITITGRVPEQRTPSSVSVITATDIERMQVTSVFEALRASPGVIGAQSGGPGQLGTIRLRGAASGQTLTLIDGVPVNDTTSTSGYNFAFLDSGAVERIEVLRGAGSAIWGSDAIGGVINIITFAPGVDATSAYAEGGSLGTVRLGARANRTIGALTVSGFATGYKTDGISAADERDGATEQDGADAFTLGGRAGLDMSRGFSAQIGARTTQGHADFDEDPFGSSATGVADSTIARSHSRESLVDGRLGWRAASGQYGVTAATSRSLTKTLSESFFGPFAVRSERVQQRILADVSPVADHTIAIGAEHSKLRSVTTFAPSASTAATAAFATYQGELFERALIEGGVRHENDERYGGVTTGRIAAAIDVWRGGVVRAAYGTGFRAPTVFESNGAPFKLPNPDLQPEKSSEWEIGAAQSILGGDGSIAIVYFDRKTKNLITGAGSPFFFNLPRADSKGVELSANATLGQVDLDASATYNEATDHGTGRQLDHVPEYSGALDATWRPAPALSIGGRLLWNGEENDFNFGAPFAPVSVPSWTRLDLRSAYHINDRVQVYARIENLTDEHYQDVFGYGTSGRAAYFGVRLKKT